MSNIPAYGVEVGDEFWVNTSTAEWQGYARTTALSNGGYVVIWCDGSVSGQPTPFAQIRGQVFDANGVKVGAEFTVDQSTGTVTVFPSVDAGPNGFVVAWNDNTNGVRARAFDNAGTAVSAEFGVPQTAGASSITSVAVLANGNYMITWQANIPAAGVTPAHNDVRARLFDANNNPLGNEFTVSSSTDFNQALPRIIDTPGGEFVVVWVDTRAIGGQDLGREILAQRFAADGTKIGGEIHVNTTTTGSQSAPEIAALAGGGFVVTWFDDNSPSYAVRAQRFDATGVAVGVEIHVSNGFAGIQTNSSPIGLADGSFVIAWNDRGTVGSDPLTKAIIARHFDANGNALGEAFLVSNADDNDEFRVTLTRLTSGRIVATWEDASEGLGPTPIGVKATMFDPANRVVGTPNGETLNGTAAVDAIEGLDGADTLNGLDGNDLIDGGLGNDTINGGIGNDTIWGDAGNDTLNGGASADEIYGGDGNDTINGGDGEGQDMLDGEAGDDTITDMVGGGSLFGGDGNDILTAGGGYTMSGGDGDDTITSTGGGPVATFFAIGGNGNDTITGSGAGTAVVIADAGDDVINLNYGGGNVVAGEGDDRINISGGNWTINFGTGANLLTPTAAAGFVTITDFKGGEAGDRLDLSVFGADPFGSGRLVMSFTGNTVIDDTVTNERFVLYSIKPTDLSSYNLGVPNILFAPVGGTFTGNDDPNEVRANDANDVLRAFGGNDRLWGAGGDDLLDGGLGDDYLNGGTGVDHMHGGGGNDLYVVDRAQDLIFEDVGGGTDSVLASAGFYLYDNLENLTLAAGAGDIFGVGNFYSNTITGNEGQNLLIGGAGADVIHGGANNDSLFGQNDIDQLFGDAGVDYLVGGANTDILDGGTEADALYGEDGVDYLYAGDGFFTDILVGGADSDHLFGNSGLGDYDRMDGGSGDDYYYVDTGDDLTFEAPDGGTDTVFAIVAGANNGVYLYANVENLVLLGTTTFGVGNELANTLTGNASGNWLLGGAGNDTLNGKQGSDVLFGEGGADTFVFEAGTGGDVIGDFQAGTDKINLAAYFSSYQDVVNSMHENGGTTAIDLGGGNLVVLNGVAKATLSSGDFILGSGAPATPVAASLPASGMHVFGMPFADFGKHGDFGGPGQLQSPYNVSISSDALPFDPFL